MSCFPHNQISTFVLQYVYVVKKSCIVYNVNNVIDLAGGESMGRNILVNVGEQRFDRLREERKLYIDKRYKARFRLFFLALRISRRQNMKI